MLVRVLKGTGNEWEIHALSGPLYGEKLATAEGFRLSNARFQYESITGYVVALYGAQIESQAQELGPVIKSLGIGGVFNKCHWEALHDNKNSGWYDTCTLTSVIEARYVNGMNGRIFYSTIADIEEDRLGYPTPSTIEASVTPLPEPTVAELFKKGFRKLFGG